MANIIGELLIEILGALVRGVVYSSWLKAMTWLSTRVHSRAASIALAVVMGLGLFFIMPIVTALLGL